MCWKTNNSLNVLNRFASEEFDKPAPNDAAVYCGNTKAFAKNLNQNKELKIYQKFLCNKKVKYIDVKVHKILFR